MLTVSEGGNKGDDNNKATLCFRDIVGYLLRLAN